MPLSTVEFDYVRSLLRQNAANVLESEKVYRAETCLLPLAREQGCTSVSELVLKLRAAPFNGIHRKAVEAMLIHETSFFRDQYPFEAVRREIIPETIKRRERERRLDIWCAACATGQEPYSLAMMIREQFPQLSNWTIRIIATDLSEAVLERARKGVYSQLEVNRGLSATLLVKYFTRQGLEWRLKDDVRKMVEFRPLNLVERWAMTGPFDAVFLRNVLIYFDVDMKKQILERMRQLLRLAGALFLGGAETTLQLSTAYERVPFDRQAYYRVSETTGTN